MSDGSRKRKITCSGEEPRAKKRKKHLPQEQIINAAINACKHSYWCKDNCLNNLECVNLLLPLTVEQRKQIIETARQRNSYRPNFEQFECLSKMMDGTSYDFLSNKCIKSNEIKLNAIRRISNPFIISQGESRRTPILTIKLGDTYATYDNNYKKYKIEYYKGAVKQLEDFTAELFLMSVKDFNFFRFVKRTMKTNKQRTEYVNYNDKQVLNLLQSLKMDSESHTLLLLIFLMVSYYKNFIFRAIKKSVQTVSGIDNDCLSQIMSFMLTYYSSFNTFFEDKQFIKLIMFEVSNASAGWQDILVDIIRNDNEIKQLYKPSMIQYEDSERLNVLNLEIEDTRLVFKKFINWIKQAVKNDHYQLFKILMEEHCDNKISTFKHVFFYAEYNILYKKNDGEKWLEIMESKVNGVKNTLNGGKVTRLKNLFDEWQFKDEYKRKRVRNSGR
eukprot:346395_1